MADDFRFDEKTHSYFLGDKRLMGVTSVIGVLAKPALIQWAARMAVEHIKGASEYEEIKKYEKWGSDHYDTRITTRLPFTELLQEAISAHTRKKDKAAEHGTDVHALVEEYVKLCLPGGKPAVIGESYDEKFKTIQPFINWSLENVDRFLFSERRMYNREMFVAGTADFGCILKTGQRLIGDFKTSSGVYGIDYYLQCAGYKILAEGEGDKPYDGCVIVRLGKKGPEDFDVTYNYDTKTAEDSFRACLTLYRAQEALKETAIRQ